MRDIDNTISRPLWSGTEPPQYPVLPPWGTMPTPFSAQILTISATWTAVRGLSTKAASPW